MTIPLMIGPVDVAAIRKTTNELVIEINAGGGITGFPVVVPDDAIAINASDPTSGFSFDAGGQPSVTVASNIMATFLGDGSYSEVDFLTPAGDIFAIFGGDTAGAYAYSVGAGIPIKFFPAFAPGNDPSVQIFSDGTVVGDPTGGRKGAGSINVEHLFVNGVEVTP